MSNSLHWDPIRGRMVAGLNQTLEELQAQEALLQDKITTTIRQGSKMLKGSGFIVIVPSNARLIEGTEEHAKIEDAEAEASDKAYTHGTAIIYAPIAVIRPKRDTVTSVPSKLMEQLQERAAPRPIASGGEVKNTK